MHRFLSFLFFPAFLSLFPVSGKEVERKANLFTEEDLLLSSSCGELTLFASPERAKSFPGRMTVLLQSEDFLSQGDGRETRVGYLFTDALPGSALFSASSFVGAFDASGEFKGGKKGALSSFRRLSPDWVRLDFSFASSPAPMTLFLGEEPLRLHSYYGGSYLSTLAQQEKAVGEALLFPNPFFELKEREETRVLNAEGRYSPSFFEQRFVFLGPQGKEKVRLSGSFPKEGFFPEGKEGSAEILLASSRGSFVTLLLSFRDAAAPILLPKEDVLESPLSDFLSGPSFLTEHFLVVESDGPVLLSAFLDGAPFLPGPGHFLLLLVAEDRRGNRRRFPLEVLLLDDVPPFFSFRLSHLVLSPHEALKEEELFALLLLGEEDLKIRRKEDSYSKNAKEPGSYRVVFEAEDASGNRKSSTLRIDVRKEGPYYENQGSRFWMREEGILPLALVVDELQSLGLLSGADVRSYGLLEGERGENLSPGWHYFLLQAEQEKRKAVPFSLFVLPQKEQRPSFLERLLRFFRLPFFRSGRED